jgi:hypothetical protein
MIILGPNNTLGGVAPSGASEVTCTLFGMELNTGTQAENWFKDQQQLAAAAATIYTATADGPTEIRSITVVNTDTVNASTFQLFLGGTAAANAITPVFTIPAGGMATYEDLLGWNFFDSNGQLQDRSGMDSVAIRSFTQSGTYVTPTNLIGAVVRCTGGGGGGGGADTGAGASGDVCAGSGGGAGGTAIGFYAKAALGASVSYTVGAFGAGGSSSGGDGTAGGDSTFSGLTGTGGGAGQGIQAATDATTEVGGSGGTPTGGTINVIGGHGGGSLAVSCDMATVDLAFAASGKGGVSFWGSGGGARYRSQNSITADLTTQGEVSLGYGGGGSGACDLTSATGVAGGDGGPGVIVVIEFIGRF